MTEQTQTINNLVNQSALSTQDKDDFILFLDGTSDEELSKLIDLFTNNPEEIIPFWAILKEKLLFLQILNESDSFSAEDKQTITNRVSLMSDVEFDAFINTIQKIKGGANPNQIMKEVNAENEKNHEEFMQLAQEFLDKTKEYQRELKQEVADETNQ